MKDKSHFQCFNCKRKCTVVLNSSVKALFALIAIFSVLAMAASIFLLRKLLLGTFLLAVLFSFFYLFVPMFLYIKPASESKFTESDDNKR